MRLSSTFATLRTVSNEQEGRVSPPLLSKHRGSEIIPKNSVVNSLGQGNWIKENRLQWTKCAFQINSDTTLQNLDTQKNHFQQRASCCQNFKLLSGLQPHCLQPYLGTLIPRTLTMPSGVQTIPHTKVAQNGASSQYRLKSQLHEHSH